MWILDLYYLYLGKKLAFNTLKRSAQNLLFFRLSSPFVKLKSSTLNVVFGRKLDLQSILVIIQGWGGESKLNLRFKKGLDNVLNQLLQGGLPVINNISIITAYNSFIFDCNWFPQAKKLLLYYYLFRQIAHLSFI